MLGLAATPELPETTSAVAGRTAGAWVIAPSALRGIEDDWRGLAQSAAEPNIFHDPDFALPAIAALGLEGSVRGLALHGPDGGLTGFVPFRDRRRWGVPIRVAESLVHAYAPVGTPLFARGQAHEAAAALFAWLTGGVHAPDALLLGQMPGDGNVRASIEQAAADAGCRCLEFGAATRAVLDTAAARHDRDGTGPSTRKRKELRRQRRRLADQGTLMHATARTPAETGRALAAFLELEASGWKGRRGTAAAQSDSVTAMFRDIAARLAPRGRLSVDTLLLDGRIVAAAITLGDERRWLWKIAYDERLAAYSPGVQLVTDITVSALHGEYPTHYDSCAAPGHPMIESIWRQRRTYGDLLVVPARRAHLAGLMRALESLRRGAHDTARWAVRTVRPR